MFNIADFKSTVAPLGFQKPSKFKVTIFVPGGMISNPDFNFMLSSARTMEFWATETHIPGLDLNTTNIRPFGYGVIEKRPWVAQFGECPVTFNCDAQGIQWTFFKKWLNMINNFDTSGGINSISATGTSMPYESSYKEDYMSFIYFQTFADNGQLNLTVGINEAYPISLSNMRLDWGQGDQIAKFNAIFTYRDWFQVNNNITQFLSAA